MLAADGRPNVIAGHRMKPAPLSTLSRSSTENMRVAVRPRGPTCARSQRPMASFRGNISMSHVWRADEHECGRAPLPPSYGAQHRFRAR
jgi:hypothetical protein